MIKLNLFYVILGFPKLLILGLPFHIPLFLIGVLAIFLNAILAKNAAGLEVYDDDDDNIIIGFKKVVNKTDVV